MVQVLCFSAEVTVETPVASRETTNPAPVRGPAELEDTKQHLRGFQASIYLLRGVTGHKGRELAKEASDKSWLYNLRLN